MATVLGKTQPVGTESGAKSFLSSLGSGNFIDTSLIPSGNNIFTKDSPDGLYKVAMSGPVGSYPGMGMVSYGNKVLNFTFDKNGKITKTSVGSNSGPSVMDRIAGIAGLLSGQPTAASVTTASNTAAPVAGVIDSVPKFLEKITSSSLWKRIGIGGLGVLILIIAVVMWIVPEARKTISKVTP